MDRFADRGDAGRRLGARLAGLAGADTVVLGLPKGGVVVAAEVARQLRAPLDVLLVRKLGVPSHPELAMGAVGERGIVVVEEAVVRGSRVTPKEFTRVRAAEVRQLGAMQRMFRRGRPALSLAGRTAVIVDDGIATGATAAAACKVAASLGAARIVLAAPVMAPASVDRLRTQVDALVWLESAEPFYGVGQFYEDFTQTSEAEVLKCLSSTENRGADPSRPTPVPRRALAACDRDVVVEIERLQLPGRLTVPEGATGIVVFAHGSASSRHSPRNLDVARFLNDACIATLLFDLVTTSEEADRTNAFNIALLADRLRGATRWIRIETGGRAVGVGYFGASTGAAAALMAAADPACRVDAVVARGGRVDLAGVCLASVVTPTMLVVGSEDHPVLEFNERAFGTLVCAKRLEIVAGASHLFEEPGAMAHVAQLARSWFAEHLDPVASAA